MLVREQGDLQSVLRAVLAVRVDRHDCVLPVEMLRNVGNARPERLSLAAVFLVMQDRRGVVNALEDRLTGFVAPVVHDHDRKAVFRHGPDDFGQGIVGLICGNDRDVLFHSFRFFL